MRIKLKKIYIFGENLWMVLSMEAYLCSYCRFVHIRGLPEFSLSYEFAIMYPLGESLYRKSKEHFTYKMYKLTEKSAPN